MRIMTTFPPVLHPGVKNIPVEILPKNEEQTRLVMPGSHTKRERRHASLCPVSPKEWREDTPRYARFLPKMEGKTRLVMPGFSQRTEDKTRLVMPGFSQRVYTQGVQGGYIPQGVYTQGVQGGYIPQGGVYTRVYIGCTMVGVHTRVYMGCTMVGVHLPICLLPVLWWVYTTLVYHTLYHPGYTTIMPCTTLLY